MVTGYGALLFLTYLWKKCEGLLCDYTTERPWISVVGFRESEAMDRYGGSHLEDLSREV